MLLDIIYLALSLIFILFACMTFANAVEWLGKKLNLSQGVVGSILAAVGTALPETIIPIIAILFSTGEQAHEIGIGAIAGAPFMLGTLAFFVTGAAVFIYTLLGKRTFKMNTDMSIFSRDLTFFIVVYGIAIATTFVNQYSTLKSIIAVALCLSYVYYVLRTLKDKSENVDHLDPLFISKFLKVKNTLGTVMLQMLLALAGIVLGAHLFVHYVELFSGVLGISPLILSIIITPIATELPEKLNSIIWIGKKKDTLALGNITGAMVFQSCIPVAFGIAFTPWALDGVTMISAILAFTSAILNLLWIKVRRTVNPFALMFGGLLYLIFIYYAFFV